MPHGFVPIDGYNPPIAVTGRAVLAGSRFVVADNDRLFALDLDDARVAWSVVRPSPPPQYFAVPRRSFAWSRPVWSDGRIVAHLHNVERGVMVSAHRVDTGEPAWQRAFDTPPPAAFTESAPAWDGAKTEELSAFLGATGELLVVLARRRADPREGPVQRNRATGS